MNPREEANGGNNDIAVAIEEPKLLKKSAGGEKCCIFRIPQRLENNNHKAYEPKVVSFGPYHYGKNHLQMIQEHKRRFLGVFMDKANKMGVDMKDLVEAVSELEADIRESYSESLYYGDASGSKKLIDMMLLDGCFILMLFFVVSDEDMQYEYCEDPIFVLPWIIPAIRSDLLLLENQVPFFLLETLFKKSKIVTSCGLNEIVFCFFNYSFAKPKEFWSKRHDIKAMHLLDLIRKTFIPESEKQKSESMLENGKQDSDLLGKGNQELDSLEKGNQESDSILQDRHSRRFLKLILSARKLQLKGIKFKRRKNADTLLDITHRRNLVEIPLLILDDFHISVFLNCVAFEHFYAYCDKHITSYVAFMGCLLKSEADVMLFSERGIIENYFGGSGDDISQFFKVIGKDILFDLSQSYLAKVFEGVNKYTSSGYHVQWAGFKHTHFNTPWTCFSSCAALTLLILTAFQAFFAAFPYFRPPK